MCIVFNPVIQQKKSVFCFTLGMVSYRVRDKVDYCHHTQTKCLGALQKLSRDSRVATGVCPEVLHVPFIPINVSSALRKQTIWKRSHADTRYTGSAWRRGLNRAD